MVVTLKMKSKESKPSSRESNLIRSKTIKEEGRFDKRFTGQLENN